MAAPPMIPSGAIVLTANQRLSRTLRKSYDDRQLAAGRTAWASPRILPFSTWLRELWLDASIAHPRSTLGLLDSAQTEALWRSIIAESPEGESVLDLRGAAESAMRAWELVHQYRLPLDARYSAHEDWAAFHNWAIAYAWECARNSWTDEAHLPDHIRDALARGSIPAPEHVLVAGFDEFTPQQQDVLDTLPRWETLTPPAVAPSMVQTPCADADAELAAAADWARRQSGSVGIVLLSAAPSRVRIERAFETCSPFHISMGEPLASYPLVSAALLVLRLAGLNRWPAEDAGRLLRCSFIRGGVEQASERALAEVRLRRWRRVYVSPESVPLGEDWRYAATRDRPPSAWVRIFRTLLDSAGFPGDRSLSSHEYQVHNAWSGLLDTFQWLDATAGRMEYATAVARLRELAANTEFQPQDPGARVQILGPLEAAGARFDHLWICGAGEQTWPAPAHPHPFLPLSLQREFNLPHSSPAREYEFAARTFERFKASAPDVVVSWPMRAGDVELRPSPLLEAIPLAALEPVPRARPAPLLTELRIDEKAPRLETTRPRGGTAVIRLQAACPFRAFADLRLGARPLEQGELGLSAADRGRAIHKALELFWSEIHSHAVLCSLDPAAVEAAAHNAAARAVQTIAADSHASFDRAYRDMETLRIAGLLAGWAEVERQRSPFVVAASERERTIRIGGLELAARIDRVDLLPDGRAVIIDYKANAPSPGAWEDDRPDEPQVPLYAISSEIPVAAVAFAHVGAGEQRFRGSAESNGILPGVKASYDFREELERWRNVLEPLARAFREGAAEPNPRRGATTCAQCRLTALCRIHETQESGDED